MFLSNRVLYNFISYIPRSPSVIRLITSGLRPEDWGSNPQGIIHPYEMNLDLIELDEV